MSATLEAEARAALHRLQEARRELARIPQSPWEDLEAFRTKLDRLMSEFEGATFRQRKAFLRQLEELAAQMDRKSKEGRWSPKHLKLVGLALRDAKRMHFHNARNVLTKLGRPLDIYDQWKEATEGYRRRRRAVEQELEALKARRDDLKAVPRPEMSFEEASAAVALVVRYDRLASDLIQAMVRSPPGPALKILLSGPAEARLPSPHERESPEDLIGFLNANPNLEKILPTSGLPGLLELSKYTDAKLAHLAPGAMELRRHVVANYSWLKALIESPGRGLALAQDEPTLETRARAILGYAQTVGLLEPLLPHLEEIIASVTSGRMARATSSLALYTRHGEAARKKWEGTIGKEIHSIEEQITELSDILSRLPSVDSAARGE